MPEGSLLPAAARPANWAATAAILGAQPGVDLCHDRQAEAGGVVWGWWDRPKVFGQDGQVLPVQLKQGRCCGWCTADRVGMGCHTALNSCQQGPILRCQWLLAHQVTPAAGEQEAIKLHLTQGPVRCRVQLVQGPAAKCVHHWAGIDRLWGQQVWVMAHEQVVQQGSGCWDAAGLVRASVQIVDQSIMVPGHQGRQRGLPFVEGWTRQQAHPE